MDNNRNILIVVDMQNDFVSGSLATPGAIGIVDKIKRYIQDNWIVNDSITRKEIIFTRDTHKYNYPCSLEGRNLPILHCLEETPGWCIVDKLHEYADCVINKNRFGFHDWQRIFDVNRWEPTSITICGLVSNICVVSNALILRALYPEVEINVVEDLCAGTTPELHKAAMDIMNSCMINIINSGIEGGDDDLSENMAGK